MNQQQAQAIMDRLREVDRHETTISAATFREEGTTQANNIGENSKIAELVAGVPHRLLEGPENPLRVAIPAYESFTTDGTADNTETFNLSHNLIECPSTQDIVVWENGQYQGVPSTVNYSADSFDYTDDGTGNTLHVWYMPSEGATVELQKTIPKGSTEGSQRLYEAPLALLNRTDQTEQPEYLSLDETPLQEWVPADVRLEAYVNAPYKVRLTDPDGDGATATNARLSIPALKGQDSVEGFASVVASDMSRA